MSEALAASVMVRAIAWALLQSLWQGILIGAGTALALLALRHRAASRRYVVACIGLLAMAVTFVATIAFSAQNLRAGSARQDVITSAAVFAPAPSAGSSEATAGTHRAEVMTPALSLSRERLQTWSLLMVPVWLLGILALSARLVAGWLLVERIRRKATRAISKTWGACLDSMASRLGVRRSVRILESALVSVPTLVGWLRPVILFPASTLAGLTVAQIEAIIAHELAHVRRHDYLVNVLQSAIEILLFYHPATWWVSRQIRIERENACDDIAAEHSQSRLVYARALAELETLRGSSAALGLAATDGSLIDRVRRILGAPAPDRTSSSTWIVAAVIVTVLAPTFTGARAREFRQLFDQKFVEQPAMPRGVVREHRDAAEPSEIGVGQRQVIEERPSRIVPDAIKSSAVPGAPQTSQRAATSESPADQVPTAAVASVEANTSHDVQLQAGSVPVDAVSGPQRAAEPPGLRGSPLNTTWDALHSASDALQRATNQSEYVQKAIADVILAIDDVTAAIMFANDHPDVATSPVQPGIRPDFNPPARPAPNRNINLEMALDSLKTAFDVLARAAGGNLGGFRAKANNDIAAAANDIIAGINVANTAYRVRLGPSIPQAVPPVAPNPFNANGPTGGLRLKVEPKLAQVQVDGYYAGLVDNFTGLFHHLDLTPGPHHVEIRAPGYGPLAFDVLIQPHHTTEYRGALSVQ